MFWTLPYLLLTQVSEKKKLRAAAETVEGSSV